MKPFLMLKGNELCSQLRNTTENTYKKKNEKKRKPVSIEGSSGYHIIISSILPLFPRDSASFPERGPINQVRKHVNETRFLPKNRFNKLTLFPVVAMFSSKDAPRPATYRGRIYATQ